MNYENKVKKLLKISLLLACSLGFQASANAINVTYNFTGGPTRPATMSGSTLILDGLFTGSILSGNPSLDIVWNPVTYTDHNVVDLTTGLLNGTFVMTFANGNTLLGNLFEDVTQVIPTGGTSGAFTQLFTFTGGTGEFAGATGSLSGGGVAGPGGSNTGSGTINVAATPEPKSALLLLSGLAVMLLASERRRMTSLTAFFSRRTITPQKQTL